MNRKEIEDLYLDGWLPGEIADHCAVSEAVVREVIADIERRRNGVRPDTDWQPPVRRSTKMTEPEQTT